MPLYIKNMVCNRCIIVVQQELEKLDISVEKIILGEVETKEPLTKEKLAELDKNLSAQGFELLVDSKQKLIEKIKNIIIQHVHHKESDNHQNYSDILSKSLHKDYAYLSGIFSKEEGVSIEKYIIHQKIERVKEMIIYDQLSLSEIALEMGYSSVAYLSNQFKKITGVTASAFKKTGRDLRKPIDKV